MSDQLGVQLNEPPQREQEQEEQDEDQRDKDFFANVGDAIRTLREDYPLLFAKDLNCERLPLLPGRPALLPGRPAAWLPAFTPCHLFSISKHARLPPPPFPLQTPSTATTWCSRTPTSPSAA
jgi:hypothetical protein